MWSSLRFENFVCLNDSQKTKFRGICALSKNRTIFTLPLFHRKHRTVGGKKGWNSPTNELQPTHEALIATFTVKIQRWTHMLIGARLITASQRKNVVFWNSHIPSALRDIRNSNNRGNPPAWTRWSNEKAAERDTLQSTTISFRTNTLK